MTLYAATTRAATLRRGSFEYYEVLIHWYNTAPVSRPYDTLVANYASLDPVQQAYAEGQVNELFDADQAEALRRFLATAGSADLETEGEPIVLREVSSPLKPGLGYGALPVGGSAARVSLADFFGNAPGLDVQGYFDVTAIADPSRLSARYVHRVLQMLDLAAGVKMEDIRDAVDKVYERSQLHVALDRREALVEKTNLMDQAAYE
ncbi:MAG: hypothetical protein AAGI08_05875 [Bacteroidota bacterium]